MGKRSKNILCLFAGMILVFIVITSPLSAQVVPQDSLALVAFYDSTNGDNWNTNTNWKTGPVATWHGVIVSGDRVTQIILPGNGLTGTLPPAIGDLDQLGVLIVNNNAIGDTIPSQLGNANSLSYLSLFDNNFSGKIPSSLGNLSNLTKLHLYDNALTDTIPVQLGNLSLLQELDLSANQLQGTIPASLGNLSSLRILRLQENILFGNIPNELGRLSAIDILDVSHNQLSGTIPDSLANMGGITTLNLSYNELDGSIPETFGNMSGIGELILNNNQLTGGIPIALGNTHIQSLVLSDNQLTGSIPGELGNIPNLSQLYLQNNLLQGTIPINLFNADELTIVDLSHNQLSDTLATEWTTLPGLDRLYLDHNRFHGSIPVEFGSVLQIRRLHLNNNDLEGEIPVEFADNNRVYELYLNDNKLEDMPDMSDNNMRSLSGFTVFNNLLDFDDLEPNAGLDDEFEYAPQKHVGEEQNEVLYAGDSLIFAINAGGTASTYHWYHDSVEISVSADTFLSLDNVQVHAAGEYYCRVTNSIATDLVLYSHPLNLSVIDTTAPSIPEQLVAEAGDRYVRLSWQANTDPDSVYYRIFMDTLPHPLTLVDSTYSIKDTSKVLTGLTNNMTYHIRLTAVDWSGNESGFSMEVQATPVYIDSIPPAAPQNLSGVSGDGSVALTWHSVDDTGSIYYRVYMDTTANPLSVIDSTIGYADTSLTITGLRNNTTYYCRLTAVDHHNNESTFSNEIQVTPEPSYVGDDAMTVPKQFDLYQNHPNPFNPQTTIGFALPRASHVRLEVFDLLGRKVAVWLDEFRIAGHHSIVVHGNNLSSGIYYYRITTGDYQQVRRMVLLR
jgi:Leucine-rich repeat (LRR) protein